MGILSYLVLAVFCIVAVSGKPRSQNVTITEECGLAIRRETCSGIIIDAVSGGKGRHRGPLDSFQYYCRKIPGFVPCLEENKADYMILLECSIELRHKMRVLENMMTPDEVWESSINLINMVNDIICSRTNELVDLVECIKSDDEAFQPLMQTCLSEYGTTFMDIMMTDEEVEPSMLCGAIYGFASCLRDGMAEICEDSSDLLDTFYDDVVVGVIGDGIGCEEPPNPLLSFVRSMRDKLRR